MKRPKNFDLKYLAASIAARQLRDLADHIERSCDFAHWNASVSIWRKEWEEPSFNGGCLIRASFNSSKRRPY